MTQGKLDLVTREEIKPYLDSAELIESVVLPAEASIARTKVVEFCTSKGIKDKRMTLFNIAVGEAITNAIKHANAGNVYAGVSGEFVWVAVSDNGPGISALTLPGATLRMGFSTKASMGMGYSIMMDASDAIMLCTGPEGTTVILLLATEDKEVAMSLDDLPNTWDEISGDLP